MPSLSPPKAPASLGQRLQAGDASALADFYDAEVEAVYAFVFPRVGRDAQIAEDLVQETFLEGLRRIAEFDESRASLGTWLCLLSRNLIRRERRLARHHAAWEEIEAKLALGAARLEEAALAPELLELSETASSVEMVLRAIPENYRRALSRKYLDELSLEELAAELSLSSVAAKSLLARARAAFRDGFLLLATAEETR
jgi:RNA polymerase sigma-70 factor (ECF subfamily)